MNVRTCFLTMILLGLMVLWPGKPALAGTTGVVFGTVTDPTGAVVPGAVVTLRNANTGFLRMTRTDSTGSYEFLDVPVGQDYSIEVKKGGFSEAERVGIILLVNQHYRADFSLAVGAETQMVRVSATPAQVETTSTQLGDVIQSHQILSMPLNGRSYIDLLALQPGVVPVSSGANASSTTSGDLGTGSLSVNGAREDSNEFMVNGGSVEHPLENGASIIPTLDSIQEFRVITNTFDAEYGDFSGGIVNVVTKSGTNAFHGDLYEFLRNQALDSRNFFDYNQVNPVTGAQIPGSAIGRFQQNQFGGTLGGRLIRNKLFFFTDYQGTRLTEGLSTGLVEVPSLAERNGDFSAASPFTGVVRGDNAPGHFAQTLSSDLGYPVQAGEPYFTSGCNGPTEAKAGMCVFPGNVIPSAAITPAGKDLMQFVPLPTFFLGGAPFFQTAAENERLRDDKFGQRVDLNTTKWGTWSAYYTLDDTDIVNPFGSSNIPGFPAENLSREQQANLGNTHSFGASAVNELRFNYVRAAQVAGHATGGFVNSLADIGFIEGNLGIVPAYQHYVPTVALAQTGISFGTSTGGPNLYENMYEALDNFAKVIGPHTIKFGGDFRYTQFNTRIPATNGSFTFAGGETGSDLADLLIGAPDSYLQVSIENEDPRTKYGGLYSQDSWKVERNLMLNYGLRWEVSQPWYDARNEIQDFLPGKQSKVFVNAPRGLVFPNDPGVPRSLSPTRWKNFEPRLGVAYSPGAASGIGRRLFGGPGKTSIRAAFGVFGASFDEQSFLFETGNAPFGNFFSSPTLIYLSQPFKTRSTGADVGQRFPLLPPATDISFAPLQPISSFTTVDPNNVLPYAEQYNFTIQRQISNSTIFTVGYVGSVGRHLLATHEMNPGSPALCLKIAASAAVAGVGGCGPFGEDTIYNISGTTFYGTRPYSVTSGHYLNQGILDFGGTVLHGSTMGNSSFNSLQLSVNKTAGAFSFLAAYTYSKSLDNSSGFLETVDPFDFANSKGLSAFDMTHNLVFSYTYNLPFARGTSGVLNKLLARWSFSGITRFATGLPVTMSSSSDLSLVGSQNIGINNGVDQPDFIPVNGRYSPQIFNPRGSNHQYFATNQFSPQTLGTVGTANRDFFHGPGFNNWDVALHKTVGITEHVSLEARIELFNAFNHAQFNNPVGNIASSVFGRVTTARSPRIGQIALKLYF